MNSAGATEQPTPSPSSAVPTSAGASVSGSMPTTRMPAARQTIPTSTK